MDDQQSGERGGTPLAIEIVVAVAAEQRIVAGSAIQDVAAVDDDVRDADRIQDQRRGPLRDGELPGRILRDGQ